MCKYEVHAAGCGHVIEYNGRPLELGAKTQRCADRLAHPDRNCNRITRGPVIYGATQTRECYACVERNAPPEDSSLRETVQRVRRAGAPSISRSVPVYDDDLEAANTLLDLRAGTTSRAGTNSRDVRFSYDYDNDAANTLLNLRAEADEILAAEDSRRQTSRSREPEYRSSSRSSGYGSSSREPEYRSTSRSSGFTSLSSAPSSLRSPSRGPEYRSLSRESSYRSPSRGTERRSTSRDPEWRPNREPEWNIWSGSSSRSSSGSRSRR
ncbi:hypothetical protein MMC09_001566 [Bachmanniomyces sp. S44760]|nr:hypothetical protein [Bachmanniomyces sp. S44760]